MTNGNSVPPSSTPPNPPPPPPSISTLKRVNDSLKPVLSRTWNWINARPSLITMAGVTAFCTVATLAATAANVWIVYGQLKEMKSSGEDAHNLVVATQNLANRAEKQVAAMDGLRKAAEAQAAATRDLKEIADKQVAATLGQVDAITSGNSLNKSANRPWLGFSAFDAEIPKANAGIKIAWKATNAGKTPAHTITFAVTSRIFQKFPESPPYLGDMNEASRNVVVPGQDIFSNYTTDPFSEADMAAITSGKSMYYIYAALVYTEVGGTKRHITKGCFRYIHSLGRFASCPFYNEAT